MNTRVRPIIPELDGLRGIAILLVFFTHFVAAQLPLDATGLDGAVRWVTRLGWSGVDLFFVLSGFLITGILLDSKGTPGYWRNYAARRFLRIFPLYYGGLILILVILPHLVVWDDERFRTVQANQVWYWTYLVNFMLVIKGPGSAQLNTAHFWSLCVEEQFYLMWPLVVLLASRRGLLRFAAVAIVFGVAFRYLVVRSPLDPAAAYFLTPGRLDGLMVGAALAVAARDGGLDRLRPAAKRVLVVALVLLLAVAVWRGVEYLDPVMEVGGYPLFAFAYGSVLVLGLTSSGPLGAFLRIPHLRSWGKYSYGLYLIHYPLIAALVQKLGRNVTGLAWHGSHLPSVVVLCAIGVPLTYGLAWCSYHLYEKPFLSLKRYFV